MKTKTVDQLANTLKQSKAIHFTGELKVMHQFRDGAVLVVERDGEINKRFFKVTDEVIKVGKFVRGRFRYNPKTTIKFN